MTCSREPGFESGRPISEAVLSLQCCGTLAAAWASPPPGARGPSAQRPTISITTNIPETQLPRDDLGPSQPGGQSLQPRRNEGLGPKGALAGGKVDDEGPSGGGARRGCLSTAPGAVWVCPAGSLDPLLSPSWRGPLTTKEGSQVPLPPACWVIPGSPLPSLSFSFLPERREPGLMEHKINDGLGGGKSAGSEQQGRSGAAFLTSP